MWSKSKSLPWTHWTSRQSAGTTLWDLHYSSPRRWEWPMHPRLCFLFFVPSLCSLTGLLWLDFSHWPDLWILLGGHYDGVETIKSRLLPWLEASFTAASLGKPVDSKVPSLQVGMLKDPPRCSAPDQALGTQTYVRHGFYLVRGSTLVSELRHGSKRWVSIYSNTWHNGLNFLLRQIGIKISALPTYWWYGFRQLNKPLLPQLWKGPGDDLHLGHCWAHTRH